MSNLYLDPAVGKEIVTHSSLKVMRRCPKQYDYKYIQRLSPKLSTKPLERGTWMHKLLEEHHLGRDWRVMHTSLTRKYEQLFDEEKDFYGDLPTELAALMESYVWYYEDDPWKVIETEYTIEAELPNGVVYRGKVDALIEDQYGLWIVDHKTHKTMPNVNFRLLDGQSALYLWAMLKNKIKVQGFIWNYLRTVAPSKPKAIKDGSRLSKVLGDTDWLTYTHEVKRLIREGLLSKHPTDVEEIRARMRYLKSQKYKPGEISTSPFFRRDRLEKDNEMLGRVAREYYHTVRRIMSYPFVDHDSVEHNVDRGCEYVCGFVDLCTVELMGGNSRTLRTNNYRQKDPMHYYHDEKTS